jgi:hypothetical protein
VLTTKLPSFDDPDGGQVPGGMPAVIDAHVGILHFPVYTS